MNLKITASPRTFQIDIKSYNAALADQKFETKNNLCYIIRIVQSSFKN